MLAMMSANDAKLVCRYENLLCDILGQADATPRRLSWYSKGPAQLNNYLYLGDFSDADSLGMLSELGITHMLNCAFAPAHRDPLFYREQRKPFHYLELKANDLEDYDMTQHFDAAYAFIHGARDNGGKVLVYCKMGMNRSATVCVAYLMSEIITSRDSP